MKKLFLFISLLLVSVVGFADTTTDRITLSNLTWDADMDGYCFTVSLDGQTIYQAYNMDIVLPQGMTVMSDEEIGNYVMLEDDLITKKLGKYSHAIMSSAIETNTLRVVCQPLTGADFKETSGNLFTVYVNVNSQYINTKPKITCKMIKLITSENLGTGYDVADFTSRPFTIPADRSINVSVSANNKIGTLLLPFEAELPTGLKAYSTSGIGEDGQTLVLNKVSKLEALKPYIIYAPTGYEGTFTGTITTDPESYPDESVTEGLLTGLVVNKQLENGYVLQNQGEGPMFYNAAGVSFTLREGRCYLNAASDVSGAAKAYGFDFSETSALDRIEQSVEAAENNAIYDISGRRVHADNLQKGIYIQSGHKYIKK